MSNEEGFYLGAGVGPSMLRLRIIDLLVVLAVFTLVCALTQDEAAAQAITVTPANPTISAGQTQQFTATRTLAPVAVSPGMAVVTFVVSATDSSIPPRW